LRSTLLFGHFAVPLPQTRAPREHNLKVILSAFQFDVNRDSDLLRHASLARTTASGNYATKR